MAGGGSQQVSQQRIDPTVQPFVEFGLQQAKNLYGTGAGPQYYPGQTYVSPSQFTQQALQGAGQRAMAGSPLQQTALQQQLGTVSGAYLGPNPFLQGAIAAASRPLEQQFQQRLGQIQSQASAAGRYGSGAQSALETGATEAFARGLGDISQQMAYQNYAQERARQEAAAAQAPALAQSEYADLQRLLQAGQGQEAYQEQQLAADIARFNFGQQAPYSALQSYLGAVYGAPMGTITTAPTYRSPIAGGLGGGLAGYALGGLAGPQYAVPGAVAGGLLGASGR